MSSTAEVIPKSPSLLRVVVIVVGIATVASGAFQLVAPAVVLNVVAGPSEPMARYFFAIVGMFMVLFGGLALHTLADESKSGSGQVAWLWCVFQKLGASLAVLIGVRSGIFSPLAVLIAGFDFVSAILFWIYRKNRRAVP